MFITWQNLETIAKIRARIAEVSGVRTVGAPLLEVMDEEVGEVNVWFATDTNTFVILEHHGDSVTEVESFEPAHWNVEPGKPQNLGDYNCGKVDYQWPLDD